MFVHLVHDIGGLGQKQPEAGWLWTFATLCEKRRTKKD